MTLRDVCRFVTLCDAPVWQILDRDEGTGGREVWELSVEAWDEGGLGQGNSVPFTLTLTDINDNAPYLIQVRAQGFSLR